MWDARRSHNSAQRIELIVCRSGLQNRCGWGWSLGRGLSGRQLEKWFMMLCNSLRLLIARQDASVTIFAPGQSDLDADRDPTAAELDTAERLTPVELRLGAALAKIPHAIQRRGVPIAMIQAQLKGKKRGANCHAGELGRALHRRGWVRRRSWERRETGGTLTLWYPPGVDPVRESIAASLRLPRGRPPKWLQRARQLAIESGYKL